MKATNVLRADPSAETASEILRKPYARILTPDAETGTYTAEILEFPGCIAEGDSPEEAYANLEAAAKAWIGAALDLGQDIPEPWASQGYAGKIALRLPRSLHRRAAQMAARDGTSLNQFLVAAVSERVGAASLYAHMLEQLQQRARQATINLIGITVTTSPDRPVLGPFPLATPGVGTLAAFAENAELRLAR